MSRHLDEREISAAVVGGELDREAGQHLATCLDCRRKVGDMADLIGERRRRIAMDEPDWEAQRLAVLGRLHPAAGVPPAHRNRWWRPVMVAAAAVMVAVVVGLVGPRGTEIAPNGGEIPVEEILAEVDALLKDDSIPGFEVIDPGLDELESYLANGVS